MDAPASAEKVTPAAPPSWLRRHGAAVIVASLLLAWMLFANHSGIPGLGRLNEQPPPTSGTIVKHEVYGWPFASRQIQETETAGLSSSSTRGSDGLLLNGTVCLLLLACAIFCTEWIVLRGHGARAKAAAPGGADLDAFDERRRAFRSFWLATLRWFAALGLWTIGGLVLFGCGVTLADRLSGRGYEYVAMIEDIQRSKGGGSHVQIAGETNPAWISILLLLGCVIALAGVWLVMRRFRLWMALAAVLSIGAAGSLPFVLGVPEPTRAVLSFGIDRPLTPEHLALLREKLAEPPAMAKRLPEAITKALPEGLGLRSVLLEDRCRDGDAGVALVLEFEPRLPSAERMLVCSAYQDFLVALLARAVKAEGGRFNGNASFNLADPRWAEHRGTFQRTCTAEMDEAFGR